MKLFKSGAAKAAPAGPAAANATAPPAALAAPVPAPQAKPQPAATPAAPSPSPAPAAPEAAGGAPMEPEMAAILDANVKEMSEKIAKLSTSLEGAQNEKQHFEQKLEQMEERMRKLSALTEMISAQYNPFVGDAPSEREPLPSPEIGLAPPQMSAPLAMPAAAAPAMPAIALPPLEAPDLDEQPLAAMPDFNPAPQPLDIGITMPPPFEAGEEQLDDEPDASPNDVQLWAVKPGFETSMLMLGWADMLLKNVPSRESLADLISYYHNIGWIGDLARDQLLAYADGISLAAAPSGAADWRASLEVHEKSLLFLEKLKALNARGNGSRGR